MILSSSSSSLMAEAAMMGGVEAGRGASEGVRRSFTRVLGISASSSIYKIKHDEEFKSSAGKKTVIFTRTALRRSRWEAQSVLLKLSPRRKKNN